MDTDLVLDDRAAGGAAMAGRSVCERRPQGSVVHARFSGVVR